MSGFNLFYLLFICTCVGIHPGRVRLQLPIELTTSRMDAPQNVKCELTRDFRPVLSPSCVTEDSRSGKGLPNYNVVLWYNSVLKSCRYQTLAVLLASFTIVSSPTIMNPDQTHYYCVSEYPKLPKRLPAPCWNLNHGNCGLRCNFVAPLSSRWPYLGLDFAILVQLTCHQE